MITQNYYQLSIAASIGIMLLSMIVISTQIVLGQSRLNDTASNDDIQWIMYNSSKLGFSIEYPESWEVYEKQSRFEQGTDLRITSPILTEGRFDAVVIDSPPTRSPQVLTNFAIQTLVIDYYDLDYEMRLIENSNFLLANSFKYTSVSLLIFLVFVSYYITYAFGYRLNRLDCMGVREQEQ